MTSCSASNRPDETVTDTANPVFIETLRLNQFRNYSSALLQLDRRHVVLCGENGAGKTNLLEAVSFITPGRGMRRAVYTDIACATGDGTWAVNVELCGNMGPVTIGTGLVRGPMGVEPQRQIRIDQSKIRSSEELLDHSRVIWLTPAMDGLFAGPASDRRRFLDRMVLAIDPGHGKRVANYEKAMRDRNRLLETFSPDPVWLGGIEAQLASYGAAIAIARTELVEHLCAAIDGTIRDRTPFPDAQISIDGVLESEVGFGSALDLEDRYRAMLHDERALDKSAGRTLIGPHRTDLMVRHRAGDMPAKLSSTGEQKALLVGMVLAHAQLIKEMSNIPPVLLLDEIAAHLDAKRRAALFDLLDAFGCQAWMTGTDVELFSRLGERAQFVTVSNGQLD